MVLSCFILAVVWLCRAWSILLSHYPGIERFRQPLDLKAASFCDAGARIDDP
jgi:hypothetical protein